MAVMIMSGSMPFSLASASIVCINGLVVICLLELHVQPARVMMPSGIRCTSVPRASKTTDAVLDARACGPRTPSGCRPARPPRPSPAAGEPLVVARSRSGGPGRATTPRGCTHGRAGPRRRESCSISRLTCAQSSMLTLSSGVPDGPGRSMKTRTTQPGLAAALDVEQLQAVRLDDPLGHRPDPFERLHPARRRPPKHKKWARAHSGLSPSFCEPLMLAHGQGRSNGRTSRS